MKTSRRAYDHAAKIGNEGDTFKHPVLAHLVPDVATEGTRFVYVESNAGRPMCVLPEKGEWTRGVGALAASRALVSDEKNEAGRFEVLGAYRALCLGGGVQTGSTYPGSTEIAFRTLRAREGAFEMHLWETHAPTFDDLTRHFFPWFAKPDARVIAEQADGYEGLARLLDSVRPTFVLIDPPDAQPGTLARVEALLTRLVALDVGFLCWTPKGGHSTGVKDEDATRPAPHFTRLLKEGTCAALFARWTIKWAPFCQLTLPVALIGQAQRVAEAVCQAMNERDQETAPTWSVERLGAEDRKP